MTTKQQKQLKKKKEREKQKKTKLLAKRAEATAKRQQVNAEWQKERQQTRDFRRTIKQQDKMKQYAADFAENLDKLPEETRQKILHNIKVLQTLEDEYDQEQAERRQLNDQLEGQGHNNLKEKLQFLHEELAKQQGLVNDGQKSGVSKVGGSDCSFQVNRAKENEEKSDTN